MQRAYALKEDGQDIEIITDDDFTQLIDNI